VQIKLVIAATLAWIVLLNKFPLLLLFLKNPKWTWKDIATPRFVIPFLKHVTKYTKIQVNVKNEQTKPVTVAIHAWTVLL
jgi:hypothetical protein